MLGLLKLCAENRANQLCAAGQASEILRVTEGRSEGEGLKPRS